MNRVEDRLLGAAEETRQLARRRPVTRFVGRTETKGNGILILASAFAIVLVIFGLVPLLMNEPRGSTGTDATPSTVTTVATTMGTSPGEACSAQGVPLPSEAEGLPVPVAETRDAIITAAAACDIAALESLAVDSFTTSYGGGGVENLRLWEEKGQNPMATLLYLLEMNYATVPFEDGEIYVWPASATYESWHDTVSEEELDDLIKIHSEGELDQFAGAGAYLGWRTGIDQDGNWMYFVAGD